MEAQLKKAYIALLAPVVGGFIIVYLIRTYAAVDTTVFRSWQPFTAPTFFALSFTFAVALPILIRILFVNKNRQEKSIPEDILFKFERTTMYVALVTPYIALVSFILELPRFHMAGVILACLYAVYYFYPSHKRIQYERKIFRTK